MTSRGILLSVAVLSFIGALILGLSPHSTDDGLGESVACGSIFKPDRGAGDVSDTFTGSDVNGDCGAKLADAKPYMFGLFGLAGIALVGAFVTPSAPSPAARTVRENPEVGQP